MKKLIDYDDGAFQVMHPHGEHFESIQALCREVYPFSPPWKLEQLESHQKVFPEGQLICVEKSTRQVVGLAFSLVIAWDDYEIDQSWKDFTDGGYFRNHDPEHGKTLYGAEVMVHPQRQGQGIGRRLYAARRELTETLGLLRIRAGARLRGYHRYAQELGPEAYVVKVLDGKIYDPTLTFQLRHGFQVLDVVKGYLQHDPESLGFAAIIEWLNRAQAQAEHLQNQERRLEKLRARAGSHKTTGPEFD